MRKLDVAPVPQTYCTSDPGAGAAAGCTWQSGKYPFWPKRHQDAVSGSFGGSQLLGSAQYAFVSEDPSASFQAPFHESEIVKSFWVSEMDSTQFEKASLFYTL